MIPVGYCSDSSSLGYALHWTPLEPAEYHAAARVREKWRFRTTEADAGEDDELPAGWSADLEPPQLRVVDWALAEAAKYVRPAAGRRVGRALRNEEVDAKTAGIEPLPDALLCSVRWRRVVYGAWQFAGLIHDLEGRICLAGLRRSSRSVAHHGGKLLSLCDNLTVVGALEKGRAGPYPLRRLCQKAGALQISCCIAWRLRYVESSKNHLTKIPEKQTGGPSRRESRGLPGHRRRPSRPGALSFIRLPPRPRSFHLRCPCPSQIF